MNLARLYGLEGKYGDAESLFAKALAIGRVVQGDEHPNTLLTLQKMAELYRNQGKDAQAEAIATSVTASLRFLKDELGTTDMMEITADIYSRQRKYPQAEALLVKVVDSRRRVLGRDHPDTLSALASSGRVRLEQRRYRRRGGAAPSRGGRVCESCPRHLAWVRLPADVGRKPGWSETVCGGRAAAPEPVKKA